MGEFHGKRSRLFIGSENVETDDAFRRFARGSVVERFCRAKVKIDDSGETFEWFDLDFSPALPGRIVTLPIMLPITLLFVVFCGLGLLLFFLAVFRLFRYDAIDRIRI